MASRKLISAGRGCVSVWGCGVFAHRSSRLRLRCITCWRSCFHLLSLVCLLWYSEHLLTCLLLTFPGSLKPPLASVNIPSGPLSSNNPSFKLRLVPRDYGSCWFLSSASLTHSSFSSLLLVCSPSCFPACFWTRLSYCVNDAC